MKKLFLITALLFILPYCTYTQFTSLPVRLVNSSGEPLTGQAANIEFTKYPHNYPADLVAGLSVTEHGTAGNYVARGFSSFQYVKLWLGGVEQTWFDSVLTGNIFSWLSSNYVTLGTTQTITGSKITSGNWTASSTGSWLYSGSSTSNTFYKPYIINSSPWYSDYSLMPTTALLFRNAGDSLYLKREFVYYNSDDNKLYFNTPGLLGTFRLAKRGNGQLFDMNSSHFYWSPETGLNINSSVFERDSIAAKNFTGIKDTSWNVLGEPVSRYRFLSLKKPFWFNPLPFPDWKWYYKSVNESGVINARDSFTVMNHADNTFDETPFEIFGVESWSDCDTITLPVRGLYQLTYSLNLIFPYTEVSGIQQRDSAIIRVVNEMFVDIPASYSEEWKEFYDGAVYRPESKTVTRTFTLFNSVPNTKYYLQLYGILNTSLVNIAVTKPGMTYLLVR
ncbi:MAG: hypothetical protein UZ05_CHB002002503 [Chlorobi bacterium OLB5]|nr:MAG: hypothetical protein UZ05_CHB002002503 [Chlorobi bacterium OLB5]